MALLHIVTFIIWQLGLIYLPLSFSLPPIPKSTVRETATQGRETTRPRLRSRPGSGGQGRMQRDSQAVRSAQPVTGSLRMFLRVYKITHVCMASKHLLDEATKD